MKLVASLPQGALVLPGFDTDCPDAIWDRLGDEKSSEDHPQFRFANLLKTLNARHTDVDPWQPSATSLRNALISLSLRPAPVTSQWLSDGPALGDLGPPTADMTLIEAAQPRDEAVAIAVAIRDGIERGKSVALITPDRTLGRRVAAALQRWNIVPDDSSGRPLALTAPGRFLRQIGDMMTGSPRSDALIALLKHPLARTDDRGPHLRATREFELFLRRNSILSPSRADLAAFTDRRPEWLEWIGWIRDLMGRVSEPQEPNLGLILARLVAMAEWISAGPNHPSSGALWDETAGRDTRDALSVLLSAADSAPQVNTAEGIRLIGRVLSAENTRDIEGGRPDVMIWGTLEARVQGADLVILGGLNEGTWPERPAPDPWLSQKMRRQVGLLLPDRQIGLSAHDYQQSVCAREVILSRAKRDAEAQTVPSRWLNRLTNLLAGLPAQTGPDALNAMKERGQRFLDIANMLDIGDSIPPARRPAPAPPANLRPKSLSITDIQRLIRDPYAIYARYVLGLKQLNALRPEPGPAMRGDVFHSIMERFVREYGTNSGKFDVDQFLHIADEVLDALVPWPSTRAHWRGHLTLIADHVVETEAWRRATAIPVGLEVKGKISIADSDFDIRGKADRIDRLQDGRLVIYDYKTGSPPTADAVRHFDRQLLIEAVMAEMGAFTNIPPAEVTRVVHVGLGRTPKRNDIELIETDKGDYRTVTIAAELRDLLRQYDSGTRGYVSRRAMEKMRFEGDYDHLARFGEWDETQTAVPEQFR
jgi:double-strand break repair protein AddB